MHSINPTPWSHGAIHGPEASHSHMRAMGPARAASSPQGHWQPRPGGSQKHGAARMRTRTDTRADTRGSRTSEKCARTSTRESRTSRMCACTHKHARVAYQQDVRTRVNTHGMHLSGRRARTRAWGGGISVRNGRWGACRAQFPFCRVASAVLRGRVTTG